MELLINSVHLPRMFHSLWLICKEEKHEQRKSPWGPEKRNNHAARLQEGREASQWMSTCRCQQQAEAHHTWTSLTRGQPWRNPTETNVNPVPTLQNTALTSCPVFPSNPEPPHCLPISTKQNTVESWDRLELKGWCVWTRLLFAVDVLPVQLHAAAWGAPHDSQKQVFTLDFSQEHYLHLQGFLLEM